MVDGVGAAGVLACTPVDDVASDVETAAAAAEEDAAAAPAGSAADASPPPVLFATTAGDADAAAAGEVPEEPTLVEGVAALPHIENSVLFCAGVFETAFFVDDIFARITREC